MSISDKIRENALKKLKSTEKNSDIGQLFRLLHAGDRGALSKAITLTESLLESDRQKATDLVQACLPHSGKSLRIGITGVPGVGKSTFIEALGIYLIGLGKRVAVLAIDPSSGVSHGSILGDKTRMEELVRSENAFIRPSPAGTTLGGVARKTRESIWLCEAAGYDVILVETVGVGQSETAVHGMTDFFLLLKLSGAGDELQGIKRGIVELADMIVINKADGDNMKAAQLAKAQFQKALHLFPPKESAFDVKVMLCSSVENKGIEEVWQIIEQYFKGAAESAYVEQKRAEQNRYWFNQQLEEFWLNKLYQQPGVAESIKTLRNAIAKGEITPNKAIEQLKSMLQ